MTVILDWTRIPNVLMIALLLCAFASLERRSPTHSSRLWLSGWLLVLLHFVASIFHKAPGIWGPLAFITQTAMSAGAGFLFMYAAIPERRQPSLRWFFGSLLAICTLYIAIVRLVPGASWMLTSAAALFGVCPLIYVLFAAHRGHSPHRWVLVFVFCALSIFLLIFQNKPGFGVGSDAMVARHTVSFAIFFACFVLISYTYHRATAGAFITISGFFFWAASFIFMPLIRAHLPQIHIETEVGDLPKFVVAAGMLLILLEDQIEHNKFLALHDVLTGLPNRRLFQDRLSNALIRASRNHAQTALLLVDLNHFKHVNDSFGHHIGDLLLQRVGSIFAERMRRSDTVARTGGDEFSVILEEPTSRTDALHVSQALLELLKEPFLLDGCEVQAGASIGIAIFPEDASDMESLCVAADQKMYIEKKRLGAPSLTAP